jgi:serine/threonine-protein kinase
MAFQLFVQSGERQGTAFPVPAEGTVVIGRGNDADFQITDPRMSRLHCRIEAAAGGVKLLDLGSTGGTFVNGEKVKEAPLRTGDRIHVGETELVLRGDAAAETTIVSPPKRQLADAADTIRDLNALIGTQIHNFAIQSKIAEGTTGIVFKGTDTKQPRDVALKVLWPDFSKNEEAAQRFIRGMKTMFPIRHPNIVRLYSAGKYKNLCWMAMEFVPGEDLTKVIDRIGLAGMLDWQFAFRVAVQIGRALATAYEHGIVHRNITPKNILHNDKEKTSKLGDLMLAKALENNPAEQITRPGQLIGEAAYMAPERTGGEQGIDCRSDIYGLGATVYALLTGRPPFEAPTLPDLLRKIRDDEPVKPKKYQLAIGDMFEGAVLRMLAKRPEDRYQTPDALLNDLERIGRFQGVAVE